MAEAVRRAAGWSRVPNVVDGAVEFSLKDGLAFKLFKLDGRLASFAANLGPSPDDEAEADDLARRLGQLAAAAFSRRRSILGLADGRYRLHLSFDLTNPDLLPALCAEFLNDLDWWRKQTF
jgi:hypothetical protein